jgi:hypothetical protein
MTRMQGCRSAMLWGAAWCLVVTATARGQYLEKREYEPAVDRYVAGGIFFRDFRPGGNSTAPDSLAIRFSRVMPFLMFRQGPVDITLGYTTYPMGGASRATIFLGSVFSTEFPLAGSRASALVLPLLIAADFTKAESAGSDRDHFNTASVGVGTGLKYRIAGEDADAFIAATGVYHYSFFGYSFENGSSPALLGEAAVVLKRVPVFNGIAAGYRFRYQRWNTGGYFDYATTNHGIFVGVLF